MLSESRPEWVMTDHASLALGLIINLFTAVIVTRTFLHIMVALFRQPLKERVWLLGV